MCACPNPDSQENGIVMAEMSGETGPTQRVDCGRERWDAHGLHATFEMARRLLPSMTLKVVVQQMSRQDDTWLV